MRRMDAGGYAACFDHQQLALMCANSDRTIDRLGAENKQLKAENEKLRERIDAAHMSRLLTENENESLRELVRDLYEMAYPECPSAFEAAFADLMCELGVEVPYA